MKLKNGFHGQMSDKFRAAARRVARQHGQIGVVLEQLHDHARALQLQKRPDRQLLVRQLHVELVAIAVELRHEHERLIDEVGQLELLGGGERVLGAGDDDDLLRTLEQLDPLRVVTHVVERVDQVDFIVHEHIRERFRVALDQLVQIGEELCGGQSPVRRDDGVGVLPAHGK